MDNLECKNIEKKKGFDYGRKILNI